MNVVQQHHERSTSQDAAEEPGEAAHQPRERRIAIGHGAADERNSMKQAREVVEQASAQLDHLVLGKRLQKRIQRLGPESERRARRERIRLRDQTGGLGVARDQLASEPALADPSLAGQQNEAEVALLRPGELVLQDPELVAPSD